MLRGLAEGVAQVGLELNPDKTRIVYCMDANPTGSAEHEQCAFLGCTFRPRLVKSRRGRYSVGVPARREQPRRQAGMPGDPTLAHQRVSRWLGPAEIQTATHESPTGLAVATLRSTPCTNVVCSLGLRRNGLMAG